MCLVFTEYFTHDVADLAEGCIRLDSSQDMRHEVFMLVLAGSLEVSQCSLDCFVVAFCLHGLDFGLLALADSFINLQQVFWRFFVFHLELVDATIVRAPDSTSICHL